MKKILLVSTLLILGALLFSGCSQTGSTSTTIPNGTIAGGVGSLARNALAADNAILGVLGISSSNVSASSPSNPVYGADGWWTSTDSYPTGTYSYDLEYNFKVWDTSSNEVTTALGLASLTSEAVGKIKIYTSMTITYSGTSYTMTFGNSKTDPMTFAGYNTSSTSVDGTTTYAGTYSSKSYSISLDYDNLTTTDGYPNGGVTWTSSGTGITTVTGTVTFDGTNTATLAITSPTAATYSVNLDTAVVVGTSI